MPNNLKNKNRLRELVSDNLDYLISDQGCSRLSPVFFSFIFTYIICKII
uniref:Uncharacterized protein n=1 Tax=Siphoviridae sp. ctf8W5 TaxID=2825595 RepID=A0A8S5Q6F3_9CAUD|nr:MAG TPA: hypothetical protein [Siphoviridae sp. ctf8W5]